MTAYVNHYFGFKYFNTVDMSTVVGKSARKTTRVTYRSSWPEDRKIDLSNFVIIVILAHPLISHVKASSALYG